MSRKKKRFKGIEGGLLPYVVLDANPFLAQSQTYGWGQKIMNIKDIHDLGFTGKGQTIAVIDTGVDDHHPELSKQVIHLEDFTGEGFPANRNTWNGHGTATAGVIAAKDDSNGVVGWAPGVKILGLKGLTESGSGSLDGILRAVKKADEMGADIINLSLGSSQTIPALTKAFETFVKNKPGRCVIAATGNGGSRDPVNYPAAGPDVWGIGSLSPSLKISTFSSRATPGTDILMPGENILTTWKAGGYATLRGTSFSAPAFAGLVACLKEAGLTFTRKQVYDTGRKATGTYRYAQPAELYKELTKDDQNNEENIFCLEIEKLIREEKGASEERIAKLLKLKEQFGG